MNEQDFENLKDLRFTITEEMKDTIIEIAFTNQILDECELSFNDRKCDKTSISISFKSLFPKHLFLDTFLPFYCLHLLLFF